MIPFVQQPAWHLGPLTLQPFGLLVAIAVIVGLAMARRRFGRFGLDPAIGERLGVWLLVGGFLGAHLFAVLFYFPRDLAADPWLLLRVWEHISSFGGMLGGLLAMALYVRLRAPADARRHRWAYLDVAAFVFPFSLAIGRLGCAWVHDHPGHVTDAPLAVSLETDAARRLITSAYARAGEVDALPSPPALASLGFHDLGLYEAAYLWLVVLPVLLVLDRRRRVPGFFLAAFALLYLPVRFAFDFLRVGDQQYAGLTPAQWAAAAGLALLPWLWRRLNSAAEERV